MMCKVLVCVLLVAFSVAAHAIDLNQVEKELKTTGAVGWIHGAAHEHGLYVFTYRNPQKFFDYVIMSLVSYQPDVQAKLATMGRNDKVIVKGYFLPNPSPQKHIMVTSIQVLAKYEHKYATDPYQYEAHIPGDLTRINKAQFLVHAVAGDGHILVVEYKDAVLPVFVKNNALTKNLFRNDVVELNFKIQAYPGRPTHLNLDDTVANPVKVIDSIKALNGKPAKQVEGALILFPKSPEINSNVFAVQQVLPSGLKRQFTLVNFDDPDEFLKIIGALQKAWDRHPGQYVNGRNKLVSQVIRVRVNGTYNEVDPNQANAQILLKSLSSVQILEN